MKLNRGFSTEEFATRTKRAQQMMEGAGLSGLLLTTEPEIRYFSGFHTLFWQSPTRPWFLFIPQSGAPVAIIPRIGADLMGRTWIEDIRSWDAPNPKDDGVSLLIDLLAPFAARGNCIGLMKGHETHLRMPLGDYERVLAGVKGLNFRDATDIIRQLRMVKSTAEIEKIAHICAIGSRIFAQVPEFAYAGQPLDAIFRAFRIAGLQGGADDVPYLVGGADKGGYRDVISPPTSRRLRHGDILMLDVGASWDGYFCDFDRNWAVGTADDASRYAYDLLWQATQAGIEAAKPSITCRDLYRKMQSVLGTQNGSVGRLGHGLGMQLTEWPSHADWDITEIKENMVLTLEPSVSYGDGRMMVHEENIVVRAKGAELLTERAPAELLVI